MKDRIIRPIWNPLIPMVAGWSLVNTEEDLQYVSSYFNLDEYETGDLRYYLKYHCVAAFYTKKSLVVLDLTIGAAEDHRYITLNNELTKGAPIINKYILNLLKLTARDLEFDYHYFGLARYPVDLAVKILNHELEK